MSISSFEKRPNDASPNAHFVHKNAACCNLSNLLINTCICSISSLGAKINNVCDLDPSATPYLTSCSSQFQTVQTTVCTMCQVRQYYTIETERYRTSWDLQFFIKFGTSSLRGVTTSFNQSCWLCLIYKKGNQINLVKNRTKQIKPVHNSTNQIKPVYNTTTWLCEYHCFYARAPKVYEDIPETQLDNVSCSMLSNTPT